MSSPKGGIYIFWDDPQMQETFLRKEKVRTIPCPVCPAKVGENCFTNLMYPREANHKARVKAFRESRKGEEE